MYKQFNWFTFLNSLNKIKYENFKVDDVEYENVRTKIVSHIQCDRYWGAKVGQLPRTTLMGATNAYGCWWYLQRIIINNYITLKY